jgi:hypothetical protein
MFVARFELLVEKLLPVLRVLKCRVRAWVRNYVDLFLGERDL